MIRYVDETGWRVECGVQLRQILLKPPRQKASVRQVLSAYAAVDGLLWRA